MLYNKICNNPLDRKNVTHPYTWWNDAFDNIELEKLIDYCDSLPLKDADIVNDTDNIKQSIRRSKVSFIEINDMNDWIFKKFNFVIENINENFYNFDLNGYNSFQYTIYNQEDEGMYDWHMDSILGMDYYKLNTSGTRKLTLVMLLADPNKDFTGGNFQINQGRESEPININLKKGQMVLFPSFMIHRVKPVLTGIRKSIVIWVEGPKFR